MYNKIKYSITFSVLIFYSILEPNENIYNIFCLSIILLFGIPHGAVDHKIHSSFNSSTSELKFIIQYISISAGYIIWWLLLPGKAVMFFILISTYHFGQEFLETLKLKKKSMFDVIIWGAVIIILPIIISFDQISPSYSILSQTEVLLIPKNLRYSIIIFISLLALFHIKSISKEVSKAQILSLFEMLCFILVFYSLLPFIIAFTLYFILYHSRNAMLEQYSWLKSKVSNYSLKRFFYDLVGFSLLSIFGLIFLLFVIKPSTWNEITTYFFIIVSILTLPHAIIFDRFYNHKNNH